MSLNLFPSCEDYNYAVKIFNDGTAGRNISRHSNLMGILSSLSGVPLSSQIRDTVGDVEVVKRIQKPLFCKCNIS